MSSDKSFVKYLKGNKDLFKIAVIIALGILLIFAGASDRSDGEIVQTDAAESVEDLCSSVEGVGECRVLMYYTDGSYTGGGDCKVESIAVICEGADSVEVRRRLSELLSSLYGIGTNRIKIEKMAQK